MSGLDLNFRYLNREGRWLDFAWQGLELGADGALKLAAIPALTGSAPVSFDAAPDPSGPAGIAVGPDGTIYYSLPDQNRVVGIQDCCSLLQPRGLAIPLHRSALFICESAKSRIAIVDPQTSQLLEIWDHFEAPVAIAADDGEAVFIADSATKQVSRCSIYGNHNPSFHIAADAVSLAWNAGQLYVLDAFKRQVRVFDQHGQALATLDSDRLQRPMGLAVTTDSIYVGDNGLRRVLRFQNAPGYPFVGEALGYEGPVAALALGTDGSLLVHSGMDSAPLALESSKGFVTSGVLTSQPIHVSGGKNAWHSLHVEMDPPPGTHLQFFVRTSDDTTAKPFPGPDWTLKPRDVNDVSLSGEPTRFLWIAAVFTGTGLASPALRQLKVRFDQKTYFPFLPSIYNDPGPSREFFGRLLALYESFNVENETALARLPELFDSAAIPPEFLSWLASWMAARLDQQWDVAKQRQALAEAYQRDARRGTLGGLKEAVAFETGVDILIEEPIQNTSWWALPAAQPPCGVMPADDGADSGNGSSLGFTTMLAGTPVQGAIVGSTAILDHSRILNAEDFGLPLFDEVAHRFNVYLYQGSQSALTATVAQVVEREKPAHTSFHLCTIAPRMAVGFQARVGIDTVVAGPPAPTPTGTAADEGVLALGTDDRVRIGIHSRIGDRLSI